MNITASDRATLVRLASSLPKGDESRRAILAGLKRTAEVDTKVLKGHLDKISTLVYEALDTDSREVLAVSKKLTKLSDALEKDLKGLMGKSHQNFTQGGVPKGKPTAPHGDTDKYVKDLKAALDQMFTVSNGALDSNDQEVIALCGKVNDHVEAALEILKRA